MMTKLQIKPHKERYEINLFDDGKNSRSSYRNFIDKDPQKLAQIFIDLYFEGFPIERAFRIMKQRLKKKDWLGLD